MTAPVGQTLPLRVTGIVDEAEGIRSFRLEPLAGQALPPAEPGAHVDVHTPAGAVRPYSLCHPMPVTAALAAAPQAWRIAVLREPVSTGGSASMHEDVRVGSVLQVGAPRHRFAIAAGARRHRLVAGGIGVTPLMAMASRLQSQGADWRLHLAVRSEARLPFATLWRGPGWAERTTVLLDDAPTGQRLDVSALLADRDEGDHLYVCGPRGFMAAVVAAAEAAGWAPECIHTESFGGTPAASPGELRAVPPAVSSDATRDTPFDLHLARSGLRLQVPAGRTALQVIQDAGVFLPSSCEQGVCGTCLTRVLQGRPDHRDDYLTDDERDAGDQFAPCCSRSRDALLVIDL